MHLTARDVDRLTIFTIAELARRRRTRGLKLNYPEAVGLICDEVFEAAREGLGYDEVVGRGMSVLTSDDVLDGVPDLLALLQVEPQFDDGVKLVTLRYPIPPRSTEIAPGAYELASQPIEINAGRQSIDLLVSNPSPYVIQVTSHMHFAEVNAALQFDRTLTVGYRLDILAGTAVRWDPNTQQRVRLIRFAPPTAVSAEE